MLRLFLAIFLTTAALAASGPVYVVLWFDTEDYIEPAADDAALRIATGLEHLGVRATFKVVGEKARVLESRGRIDVIRALGHHDIGYHSNFHSIQPTPALYLRNMGWLDGAAEFERRERPGVEDIRRIFGILPSCYGQPGSSWAPQTFPALLRLGIPVYLDEGEHVGIGEQPFWFGGMLNVFHMGRYQIRAPLDDDSRLPKALEEFDRARGRAGCQRRRCHQHLLPPDRICHHGILGPEFRQGRQSGKERVEKTAAAHGGRVRAVLPHSISVCGTRQGASRRTLRYCARVTPAL